MSGDIIDQAQLAEDAFLKEALARKRPQGPKANGYCHFCGRALHDAERRFCDKDCADDWAEEERRG